MTAIHKQSDEKVQCGHKDFPELHSLSGHRSLAELEVGIHIHRSNTCPSHSGAVQPPWSFQSHGRNHYWHDPQNHEELPLKIRAR